MTLLHLLTLALTFWLSPSPPVIYPLVLYRRQNQTIVILLLVSSMLHFQYRLALLVCVRVFLLVLSFLTLTVSLLLLFSLWLQTNVHCRNQQTLTLCLMQPFLLEYVMLAFLYWFLFCSSVRFTVRRTGQEWSQFWVKHFFVSFSIRKLNCFHQFVNSAVIPQFYTFVFLAVLFEHDSENGIGMKLFRNDLFNVIQKVVGRWSFCRCLLKQAINEEFQVLSVRWGNGRKGFHNNILVEIFHIGALEGRSEHDHFVEDTA